MSSKDSVFSFDRPHDSPGYLLWQVTMLWQRQIKAGLDELGITHTQFVLMAALKWLSDQQPEVVQIDIANHANVDRMMTSKVLKALAKKGLISTQSSSTDSRAKVVKLTAEGEATIKQAVATVEGIDRVFFAKVGEEQGALIRMMQGLLA